MYNPIKVSFEHCSKEVLYMVQNIFSETSCFYLPLITVISFKSLWLQVACSDACTIKKRENTYGEVILSVTFQAEVCNFTETSTKTNDF